MLVGFVQGGAASHKHRRRKWTWPVPIVIMVMLLVVPGTPGSTTASRISTGGCFQGMVRVTMGCPEPKCQFSKTKFRHWQVYGWIELIKAV